ncbi:MAG: 3-oxoacyl-ACP reductase FabG [Nitrospirales bacterium]|nr:3-oxoacyl-ACP reductase FabG [Nitrospirales bacterium]
MNGKRALVTGGNSAIGSAICQELAKDGFHVIVHGHSHPESSESVASTIQDKGGTAETVSFDLTEADATLQALQGLLEQGPVQVLVHNAGMFHDAPMAGMTAEQWKQVIDVSLNGFFHVTQPLLLPMIRTRWGRIITISSLSGMIGHRGQTNYAAAKAGLHGASKSLAFEVASRGITVNVVAPGLIQSPSIEHTFTLEQIESMVPMKRVGQPEEVAVVVGFLASERASYLSGQVIGVNGAMAS